jgi:ATP adenylyltransferase
MPVISDTNVIVEALDESYHRLRDGFASLDGAEAVDEEQAVRFMQQD